MLYVECGYWEPGYAEGDEICVIRGNGGWQGSQEILAKAWLPKPEPESPYIATIVQMASEAGIEFDAKDVKFMAAYMDTMTQRDAMLFLIASIQAELYRIAEQERIEAERLAILEEERTLGYSPTKFSSAWESMKNRKAN